MRRVSAAEVVRARAGGRRPAPCTSGRRQARRPGETVIGRGARRRFELAARRAGMEQASSAMMMTMSGTARTARGRRRRVEETRQQSAHQEREDEADHQSEQDQHEALPVTVLTTFFGLAPSADGCRFRASAARPNRRSRRTAPSPSTRPSTPNMVSSEAPMRSRQSEVSTASPKVVELLMGRTGSRALTYLQPPRWSPSVRRR